MAYAERHGIPVPTTPARPYSMDRNLFHISYEGGILEDPWAEPPDKMFLLTRSPEEAPDVPTTVEIEFEAGNPVAVDGQRLGPVALLERLNRIGGENGVGRIDLVENRYVGMKSRGVYETPGERSSTRRTGRSSPSPWTGAPAPPRLPGAALRRDGLLRLLVRPRARGAPGPHGPRAARRHRHRAASSSTRGTSRWPGAGRRARSIGRTS